MTYDTDIIIIGAGVAGLSASKVLSQHHIPHRIVEASHRIGGRAYSEVFADGSWFDLGCSYLHEGETNPLTPIARAMNIPLGHGKQFAMDKWQFGADGNRINGKVAEPILDYFQKCQHAMNTDMDTDSIADIMDWNSPVASIFNHCMAGLCAADAPDLSIADYMNSGDGLDYPVADGLGQMITHWAADIPVTTNCAVSHIEWKKDHIRVKTGKGTLTARKVLITVSTGILASGLIRFTPSMPDPVMSAVSDLPCGILNKIGMSFAPDTFSDDMAGWHIACPDLHKSDTDAFIGSVDINTTPRGHAGTHQQAIVFAGGGLGEYLEKQGIAALTDYARQTMTHLYGSHILKTLTGTITTAWATDPWTLGSYSYARPGAAEMRKVLMEPIDDTIFFAGEAASITHYGTCHGAYISGRNTAINMIA
ncbi:MAG: flavin monoamine oxidase family protein [Candidatus Puniceispirillales bacterium]